MCTITISPVPFGDWAHRAKQAPKTPNSAVESCMRAALHRSKPALSRMAKSPTCRRKHFPEQRNGWTRLQASGLILPMHFLLRKHETSKLTSNVDVYNLTKYFASHLVGDFMEQDSKGGEKPNLQENFHYRALSYLAMTVKLFMLSLQCNEGKCNRQTLGSLKRCEAVRA